MARQLYFTGVQAIPLVGGIAILVGASVVVQAQLWLTKVGQTTLLGPLLVGILVTNLAPLLVNFIVIGRSGTAIATELGNMCVSGELKILDSQGVDPFLYLIVPRVLSVAISVFCLTAIFITVSVCSGYLLGLLVETTNLNPLSFAESLAFSIRPETTRFTS